MPVANTQMWIVTPVPSVAVLVGMVLEQLGGRRVWRRIERRLSSIEAFLQRILALSGHFRQDLTR
jgi:hypothetical protein